MMLRRFALLVLMVIGGGILPSIARAQEAAVILSAAPGVIMADGRSSTTITATMSGLNGSQVSDGTVVRFATTAGTLSQSAVSSVGGVARVTLTSSPVPGFASVSATFIGSNGSGSGQYQVEFTSEKELANTDQGEADWIRVFSPDYLAYSADSKIIDASSKNRGVKFSYHGLVILADALQADMSSGEIRARNALMERGNHQLAVRLLSYNITSAAGQALSDNVPGSTTVQMVAINGSNLSISTVPHDDFNGSALEFVDISDSRVLITASSVAVRMNDKIQLKHASIYVDSKRIVSMPFQIMPLQTNEIFGQQLVGYGSDGLFLDVPYYAAVSPKSTSAFYLRSATASEQDGTYYNDRAPIALDYVNTYGSFDGKVTGNFDIMGLSTQHWGAQWTHTEQFSNSLHGYFYVDAPEHNSLFASSNLAQQFRGFSLNLNAQQSNSAAFDGYSSSDENFETYLQTDPHRLNGSPQHGLFYSEALTVQTSLIRSIVPNFPSTTQTISTRSAGLNLFTSPFKITSKSQFTDSINFSQAESNTTGTTGVTANAVMNLNTRFSNTTSSTLSYDFSHDPVAGNVQNNAADPLATTPVVNQSNYSASFNMAPKDHLWNTVLMSTYSDPLGDTSFSAGFNYYPSTSWQVGFSDAYSQFGGIAYRDFGFSLGRRIGSREIELDWSSIDQRFRVNMGSAQF
jgi:hypothetical protein